MTSSFKRMRRESVRASLRVLSCSFVRTFIVHRSVCVAWSGVQTLSRVGVMSSVSTRSISSFLDCFFSIVRRAACFLVSNYTSEGEVEGEVGRGR